MRPPTGHSARLKFELGQIGKRTIKLLLSNKFPIKRALSVETRFFCFAHGLLTLVFQRLNIFNAQADNGVDART